MNLRERSLFMAAIVLLGLVVFKLVIYDPYQSEHASLVAAREAARAELRRNQEIIARGDQVRKEYARLVSVIAALQKKLPTTKEIPALLTAMEQFVHKLGVDLNGIHPGALTAVVENTPAKPGQTPGQGPGANPKAIPYSKIEVNLNLTATFSQMLTYLRELRDFPRLVVVKSIAMNPQQYSKLGVTVVSEIYVLGASPGETP
jgi:Tfp pilus assembly protein PilO